MKRSLAALLSLSLAFAPVFPANAGPTPIEKGDDEAAALKKKGDEAMLDLRYEDALDAYGKSYAKKPNPALHYNRARALEALGRYAEALGAYESFVKDAPPELLAKVPGLADHLTDVKKRVTDLTLRVDKEGARVLLRNVVIGTSPFTAPLRVNAGKATLEVTADGFKPYKRELELPGGEAMVVDVKLEAITAGGVLIVSSEPSAAVSVDGAALGTTPVETRVTAGSHTITLSKSGFVTRTSTVVVAEGDKKKVDLGLEAEPSGGGVLSKWWFWTSVGVVVVGGAVLTYSLVTTSRDAGKGDIDPGRISAPLMRF